MNLHTRLKERNTLALFPYWLDGAHQLSFMGTTLDAMSQKEVTEVERRLQMCFEDMQEYLEKKCGYHVNSLELSFDARGQRLCI